MFFLEQCVAKIVYENGGNQGLHSFPMTLFKQDSWASWRARAHARAWAPYVHRPYPRSCQVRFSVRRSKNLLLPAEFRRGKKLYTCWSKWWQPWKNSPPVNLGQAPSIRGIRVPRPPTTRPLWPWRRTRTPPIPPVSLKSIWILGTLKLCLASSKLFN